MAEKTNIDISKIEKILHNLVNQFGIRIEKSDHEMSENNQDMLWFRFFS